MAEKDVKSLVEAFDRLVVTVESEDMEEHGGRMFFKGLS